ncbi:MAG: TolC family protein [Gemmatimonadaceae bacterium]
MLLAVGAASFTAPQLPAQTAIASSADIGSLRAALGEANEHAFANRVARATADGARSDVRLAWKSRLPALRVESGLTRTTDPVAAFGTTLRQGRATPEAFVPARLNDPAAATNVGSGIVLEIPVLNADAPSGIRAANAISESRAALSEWTAATVQLNVVRTYFGAILASETVQTLESAERAALAALRQTESMVRQGLVTKADALLSDVHAANVTSDLNAARSALIAARQDLAFTLGRHDETRISSSSVLPSLERLRKLAALDTLLRTGDSGERIRSDLRASMAGLDAAVADRNRLERALMPRVNSFARYDWNSPSVPFGGKNSWTIGVVASWSVFDGGATLAQIGSARAREAAARASLEASVAQGDVDADKARRAVVLQLTRLDLALRAERASVEAARLLELRYAGGLATISELLDAQTRATHAQLGNAAARFALIDAMASLRLAIGADLSQLADLEEPR